MTIQSTSDNSVREHTEKSGSGRTHRSSEARRCAPTAEATRLLAGKAAEDKAKHALVEHPNESGRRRRELPSLIH